MDRPGQLPASGLFAVAVAMVALAASTAATYGAARSDRKPPTQPTQLQATTVSSTAVALRWRASRDNSRTVSYAVFVDGRRVGSTVETKFLVTGLACGRLYFFQVRAFDRSGNYSSAAHAAATTGTCEDLEPPSSPTGIVQLERTASSITVAWTQSTDNVRVVAYDLYRDGQFVGETAESFFIFGSLGCARTYALSVAARDAAGNSSQRATVLMSTAACPDVTPPSPPTALAQTAASSTSVTLAWNPSSDNVGVVAYDVYRNGEPHGSTTQTSASINGLSCGTSYSVGVAARDAAGNRSAPASVVVATAPCQVTDTTPPSVPQNLRVEPAATSLTMTWSPSTDNVGVTGYNVYLDGAAVDTTTQTSYTYAGLRCGTTYVVAVEARDAAGNVSNRAQATGSASTLPCAGDTTPPSQPGQVTVSAVTATSVTLAWSAASDDVGVVGYGIYRNGARIADVGGGARSYVVTGLPCGTSTSLAVDAVDAAANRSAPVAVVGATAACPDTESPSTPSGLSATGAAETSVSLRWAASTDNVGVTGYGVYLGGLRVADTPSPSFVVAGLVCGRAYTVAVDAHDAAGNRSAQSSLVVSTASCPPDTQAPSVPAGLAASGQTQSSVALSWSAASDNVGVAGYGVYRDGALVGSAQGTSYTFAGLACGRSYTLGVDAYDAAGNRSGRATFTAATATCPATSSASVFLSPSGSDSNLCSQPQPCRTFNRAYTVAVAGATVELAAGDYDGQSLNATPKTGANVVFRPAAGAQVTVRSIDITRAARIEFRDFAVTNATYNREQAQWITYRRIAMRQFFIRGADHIHYYDSEVGPNVSNDGMNWITAAYQTNDGSSDVILDGMRIHDFKKWNAGAHVDCIGIDDVDGLVIRNTKIWNCEHFSLIFGKDLWSGRAARNVMLESNFFDCCFSGYYSIGLGDIEGPMTIRFNSLTLGIGWLGGSVQNVTIDSNVISNNSSMNCSRATWQYNVVASGSACGGVIAPTGFRREPDDLHLVVGARAVDAGNPASYPATDIDGQARPMNGRPDAGADEAG